MKSDVKKSILYRILTAAVGLPIYIFALYAGYFNSIGVLIASMAVTLVSLHEYYRLCEKENGRPFILWGITIGAIINIVIYLYAFGYVNSINAVFFEARIILLILILFISIILIKQMFTRPIKGGIYSTAVTVFGVVYIVFFFSHVILMKAMNDGFLYILMLNIVIMINDSAAYFGGVLFGKHKLNFPVSPNKSWEGYFSGIFFSIIAMIAANVAYGILLDKHLFSVFECIILGAFLSALGHIGDLAESAIKRDAEKKDSGSFFPGHGGMWDIFDALIFSYPFFYYYLILR